LSAFLDSGHIWDAIQGGAVVATGLVVFWYTYETRLTRLTTEAGLRQHAAAIERERADARLSFEYFQFRLWRQLVTWTGQKYEDIDQRLDRWARRERRDAWFVHAERASLLLDRLMTLAVFLEPTERERLYMLAKNYLDGQERLTKAFVYLEDMPRNQARYTKRIHDAAGNFHACVCLLHGQGAILSGWLSSGPAGGDGTPSGGGV